MSSNSMASDDSMTIQSSMHEDEDEDDHDLDVDQQYHPRNLSRLSICSSSKHSMIDFEDGGCGSGGDMMMMFMSGLSVDDQSSSYGDEEFSDHKGVNMYGRSSDSDKEDIGGSCLSLPGIPLQIQGSVEVDKEYCCSENEATGEGKGKSGRRTNNSRRKSRRRAIRERWLDREWEKKKDIIAKTIDTRPDGVTQSLYMDLGEVKACRDLGFELEYPTILDIPNQISSSTIDTASSGGNSPMASWRISSPGDDPKDVKARLKVWAQAVAASASRLVD